MTDNPETRKTGHPAGTTRLFLHVPKTAGTSFRKSVIDHFGDGRVLRDYGEAQAETSKEIIRTVYAGADPSRVSEAIAATGAVLVCGHLSVARYGGVLGLPSAVTLLRNPVERVVSHFRHAVRHQGFEGSLMEFATERKFRNVQRNILAAVDPALIGIIGLTERYADSIRLVNHRWGWNLSPRRDNVGSKLGNFEVEIKPEQARRIRNLNRADVELYRRAELIFSNAMKCLEHATGREPRGAISTAAAGQAISGWACHPGHEEPLELELVINGDVLATLRPTAFRVNLAGWGVARHGYVGFGHAVEKLRRGDLVEIRDAATGLTLDRKKAK